MEKVGGERIDVNYDLRMRICEYVRQDFTQCPTSLLLDLYRSLAESTKYTFSVYTYFHLFANEILEREGVKCFDIYQTGARQSFDSLLASARLDLSQARLEELILYLQQQVRLAENEQSQKDLSFMLKRFQAMVG